MVCHSMNYPRHSTHPSLPLCTSVMTMHLCTEGAAEAKNGTTDSSEKQHKRQQRKQHSEISVTVTDEWENRKKSLCMKILHRLSRNVQIKASKNNLS